MPIVQRRRLEIIEIKTPSKIIPLSSLKHMFLLIWVLFWSTNRAKRLSNGFGSCLVRINSGTSSNDFISTKYGHFRGSLKETFILLHIQYLPVSVHSALSSVFSVHSRLFQLHCAGHCQMYRHSSWFIVWHLALSPDNVCSLNKIICFAVAISNKNQAWPTSNN